MILVQEENFHINKGKTEPGEWSRLSLNVLAKHETTGILLKLLEFLQTTLKFSFPNQFN